MPTTIYRYTAIVEIPEEVEKSLMGIGYDKAISDMERLIEEPIFYSAKGLLQLLVDELKQKTKNWR